ncbi:MAG: histone H1 [Solirubrobacteraceae bacterium]
MADLNQLAARIVREATDPESTEPKTLAQVNGRNGGLKGGKARAAKLSPAERVQSARKAAQARWGSRST